MLINEITEKVIGFSIDIHRSLGPGLLESAYEECLTYELKNAGFKIERQKPMPLLYKDIKMDFGYRIDLLVENQVIVELKTVESFSKVHEAQILTYMKLSKVSTGLLINFNSVILKNGIRRFRF
ncbi:MAG: GxxExxY protein [Bacteroidetes bacterium]|nr:GxxExxY protein [Bacteroidota bacterium]